MTRKIQPNRQDKYMSENINGKEWHVYWAESCTTKDTTQNTYVRTSIIDNIKFNGIFFKWIFASSNRSAVLHDFNSMHNTIVKSVCDYCKL